MENLASLKADNITFSRTTESQTFHWEFLEYWNTKKCCQSVVKQLLSNRQAVAIWSSGQCEIAIF